MAPKKRFTPRHRKQRSFLVRAFKWALVLTLWIGLALTLLLAWYASELPGITEAADFERRPSIAVKAADGTTLTHYGDIKGARVGVEDMPSHLIYAVLAIEDRRFYSHWGVDPLGLARAMAVNLIHGRVVQGGSTITQQLAKNLFLSHERTFKRKVQEAMLALWLEYGLTKDEILSAYMNRVYLGAGTYGMDAAARLYFGKSAADVNLREAAILAGLLKAPSRYSPLANPDLAQKRSEIVLAAMADAGYITEEQADNMKSLPPVATASGPSEGAGARYFTDWVVDGLDELIGTPDQDITIETTLIPAIQRTAEAALTRQLDQNADRSVSQGAALALRADGAVLAMVGGKNYRQSQFNRAVQAKRQPGSSFKPFVYLSALENGWNPDDIILDAPFIDGDYRPTNFKNEYYGNISLEAALMLSLNTATVRLMEEVGRDNVIATAQRAGIISPIERNLSSALGSSAASLLEMTTAYAAIAGGGLRVLPYAITRITGKDGRVYYQRPDIVRASRVIERGPAGKIQSMMRRVIENGTGRAAALPFTASGKTGTSQDFRDAWFIGFADEVVAGVWVGNDDNSPMNRVTGGSIPALVWKDIMLAAHDTDLSGALPHEQDSAFDSLLGRLLGASSETRSQSADEVIYWNSQRAGE